MQKRLTISISIMSILIALSAISLAQERRQSSQTPVVTSEEVLRISRGRGGRTSRPAAVDPAAAQAAQIQEAAEAERLWRERLERTIQQTRELRRRADMVELEINRQRNILYSGEPRARQTHNGLIASIDVLTVEMRALRAEAADAQAEVDSLMAEGQARGFSVAPSTARRALSGRDEYRSRYNELNIDLLDAQRRAEVLQLRLNDINRRLLLNSGTGDEFYAARLREQLQATEDDLYNMRARIAAIRLRLDEVRQQALAAGVNLN